MNKREIGKHGEQIAADYLIKKGYLILEENAHERWGEIDLIAQDPATKELVFVEVKLRNNEAFGHSEEALNDRKIRNLIKAALRWLEKKEDKNASWRIDLLAIQQNGHQVEFSHLKDITAEWC